MLILVSVTTTIVQLTIFCTIRWAPTISPTSSKMAKDNLRCRSIAFAAEAPEKIDYAIRGQLREKSRFDNEIACNISAAPCAAPGPVSSIIGEEASDPHTLSAAVDAAVEFLRQKTKPILLIGSKLRAAGAEKQAIELAEALGCSVAVMAAAKSFFPEDHPQFAGIYWGEISSPNTQALVDWSDGVVCIGTLFNDYSTVGWTGHNPPDPTS